jgi:hypothetical protein
MMHYVVTLKLIDRPVIFLSGVGQQQGVLNSWFESLGIALVVAADIDIPLFSIADQRKSSIFSITYLAAASAWQGDTRRVFSTNSELTQVWLSLLQPMFSGEM